MKTSDSVQDATHQLECGDNKRNPLGPKTEAGNRNTKSEELSSNDIMVQQKQKDSLLRNELSEESFYEVVLTF